MDLPKWRRPHIQTVRRLPAIEFPPGTTYQAAVNRLLRSVVETGAIPRSARIVGRLPAGIVWQIGGKRHGPRLDLTAPWGYTLPGGIVRTPTLRIDPSGCPAIRRRETQNRCPCDTFERVQTPGVRAEVVTYGRTVVGTHGAIAGGLRGIERAGCTLRTLRGRQRLHTFPPRD